MAEDKRPCVADMFVLERLDKIFNTLVAAEYAMSKQAITEDWMERRAIRALLEELGIEPDRPDRDLLLETAGKYADDDCWYREVPIDPDAA
jgi:hypothetical protein